MRAFIASFHWIHSTDFATFRDDRSSRRSTVGSTPMKKSIHRERHFNEGAFGPRRMAPLRQPAACNQTPREPLGPSLLAKYSRGTTSHNIAQILRHYRLSWKPVMGKGESYGPTHAYSHSETRHTNDNPTNYCFGTTTMHYPLGAVRRASAPEA